MIEDEAILTFTRSFYSQIWEKKSRICEAYQKAKLNVLHKHGKTIADKFLILKEHKSKNCEIFGNFVEGEPKIINQRPKIWDLPTKPMIFGF
jgi:uncharacterized protein YcsI (UPF0317 family)